jgi:hypothetical protein
MYRVNELRTLVIEATFYDEDGVLDIPGTGHYKLYDKATGTIIIATTAITITASTYRITIPNTLISLIDRDNESETKVLVLDWTDGGYVGRELLEFDVVKAN